MKQTILEATFGYDMTINCYFKVIKDGEKTALVQEIGKLVTNDDGTGKGRSLADPKQAKGKPFRAYKRDWNGKTLYVSKYFPSGTADEWDGKPSYYNTWD